MTNQSKKDLGFYLTILDLLRQDIPPSRTNSQGQEERSIAAHLQVSKQNLKYHIKKLKDLQYIKRIGMAWTVLVKDNSEVKIPSKKRSSLGATKLPIGATNLHAFNIEFPILDGKILSEDWEIKEKLNNWIPKYKKVTAFEGLTFKNNNNKSITVFCHSRDLKNIDEVDTLAFKLRSYVFEYFKVKENVTLDVFEAKVKNLHLATQDDRLQGLVRKGEVTEVDLQRKAEKIFPKDDRDAKAWIDNSPKPHSVETNDLAYKRAFIMQPLHVEKLTDSMFLLEDYNKNLKLHIEVQEEQLKTQKKIQELLERLNK